MPLAVGCLARLLREPAARALFTRASGASLLAPLLRGGTGSSSSAQTPPSHQLLYEAGLCVWQLTFYSPALQAMAGAHIVPSLVDMARHASKEKVLLCECQDPGPPVRSPCCTILELPMVYMDGRHTPR